jgi:hypothetical protein
MAEIYADAGYTDRSFEWLENAVKVKDPGAPWAFVLPFFHDMKTDPRWQDYRARFNL